MTLMLWCGLGLGLCGLGSGCSSAPTYPSGQLTLRLIRAWSPHVWSVVGALRGRGPLRVSLWREQDFKRSQLAERAWVSAETLRQLRVDHAWSASGEPLLYREELTLDGLGPRVSLNLYVGSRLTHPMFPRDVDIIVPLSLIATRFGVAVHQLKQDTEGLVRAVSDEVIAQDQQGQQGEQSQREGQGQREAQDQREGQGQRAKGDHASDDAHGDQHRAPHIVDHPTSPSAPHLNRFRRWRFERAYRSAVIGARVDLEGESLIKWRRPKLGLPQELWILADVAPPGERPELLYVWLKPETEVEDDAGSRAVTEATTIVTRLVADLVHPTPSYVARCTYKRPCPVRILDVEHRFERCLNDSCTYRVSRPRAHAQSDERDERDERDASD